MYHEIEITHLERFERNLEGLKRRAVKLGLPVPSAERIGVEHRQRFLEYNAFLEPIYVVDVVYTYGITSVDLVLPGGWELVAVMDLREGLVKAVPGAEVSSEWWDTANRCDHCNQVRDRTETFLVHKPGTGEYKVVGRTCLGDFLGVSPAEALKRADWFKAFYSDMIEDEPASSRVAAGYELEKFLAYAVQSVRQNGWVNKAAANTSHRTSTANESWFFMTAKRERLPRGYAKPTSEDYAQAKVVVEFMTSLDPGSDYEHNLKQIGLNGFVTSKSAGYAASAVVALAKRQEQRKAAAERKHLGMVGQKLEVEAKLLNSPSYEGAYGVCFFHKFQAEDGNILLWKTSTELEQGASYKLKAKVKAHNIYGGAPETEITRANYQRL